MASKACRNGCGGAGLAGDANKLCCSTSWIDGLSQMTRLSSAAAHQAVIFGCGGLSRDTPTHNLRNVGGLCFAKNYPLKA